MRQVSCCWQKWEHRHSTVHHGCESNIKMRTIHRLVGVWLQNLCPGRNIIALIMTMVAGLSLNLQPWRLMTRSCSHLMWQCTTINYKQSTLFATLTGKRNRSPFRDYDVRSLTGSHNHSNHFTATVPVLRCFYFEYMQPLHPACFITYFVI